MGEWRTFFACVVLSDASSPGEGQNWQSQDDGGGKGSKVHDRLVGRTWLCYSCDKLLRLPGGCFLLRFASILLGSWSTNACSGVLCLQVLCLQLALPKVSATATTPAGRHVMKNSGSVSFFFSFSCSELFCPFPVIFFFFSLFHRMCTSCLSYISSMHYEHGMVVYSAYWIRMYLWCIRGVVLSPDHCLSIIDNRIEGSARTRVVLMLSLLSSH